MLLAGWLVGLVVPIVVIAAPTWGWIVFANALLGVNQGLCWSSTVIMKIDLVGPTHGGLALGLNEFAGYLAVGVAAFAGARIAAVTSLRPEPFVVAALGGLASVFVQDTRAYAELEASRMCNSTTPRSFRRLFADAIVHLPETHRVRGSQT